MNKLRVAAFAACAGLLLAGGVLAQTPHDLEEHILWLSVSSCTSLKEVDIFLTHFPEGKYAAKARKCLRRLANRVGREFQECDVCPWLVVVPAGEYKMGSPSHETGRHESEGPVREVTIARPFAVGKYEVTFDEWDACVAGGGCNDYRPDDAGWGRGRLPVFKVSWNDAQAYVRWLSSKTGAPYRLLSEAEWEYVARAGSTGPFHYGAKIATSQANFRWASYDNTHYLDGRDGVYRGRPVQVGKFLKNAWGLHDIHGNVGEWVEDCWHEGYDGAPSDGSARTGSDCQRVWRGGFWYDKAWDLRSAKRSVSPADFGWFYHGLRVARTLAR